MQQGSYNIGTPLHAAAKGIDFTAAAALNRTDPEAVKAEIIAAGFVLDGESSALTRADDDHAKKADDVLTVRGASPADTVLGFAIVVGLGVAGAGALLAHALRRIQT